ncbi:MULTISPECIES: metal ABC transporter solute-binding protein, Zn/Mn family [Pontibacillus]|uniref:Zinc ABC transporter substrate-binding protein n=1 Tax=Pontibacillus chungwhensis TaxID=265426 RepID=A0ABY8UYE4_9BACI|nr:MULTISPECIES: zinc ABC transporter substrate-binding protein [Pontibacillus]MCD5324726.1 zinc ABC transporter substrate-binding protein [Pontibacillus sp. HN14]WIF98685.1 zinc ABC transporter substrate-binding protein [Pontibacillus chungwhensis]
MKKLITIAFLTMIALVGCNASDDTSGDEKVKVVTTIAQIGDIAENIGGEHVNVKSLMGPGTDPHTYKATTSDIENLQKADVIFYNGHHLEGQMNDVFAKMRSEKPTHAVAEAIPEDMLDADPANPDIPDPHVWFDINLWKYAVDEVTKGLSDLDPENQAYYEKQAEKYKQKLDETHTYAKEQISQIPEESRVLVTAHDAFHYFGKAYGLEVMGLQGLSTESEYGLKDVQRIIDTVSERNIKAVFVESSVNKRSINAVVEGAKAEGHNLKIGGELYSDAMGPADTEEGTYIGMFRHNIETIVSALK